MRWPSKKAILSDLKYVRNEANTYDPAELDGGIDVRLQVYENGEWYIHTGDSSYDQDHRGYWGAGMVAPGDTNADLESLAHDLLEQAKDHAAQ